MTRIDVLVIGAGAAGLMAGIEAARRGRRVVVVDHAAKPGEKIRISGGGRCNFTNLSTAPERFLSANPRFALSALRRFTPQDFIDRLTTHRILWEERSHGQLFCTGSAKDVVQMLVSDLTRAGGDLWLDCAVSVPLRDGDGFVVQTPRGQVQAASIIIATGGKSIPKMGATGFGYEVATRFGLAVTDLRPGLVPFTFAEQELTWIAPMAGLSTEVQITVGGGRFRESMLFTHRGLSGPAVLQISSYWREGQPISVDLYPGADPGAALRGAKRHPDRPALGKVLAAHLPDRLARHLAERLAPPTPLVAVADKELDRIGQSLSAWVLKPVGTEGYRTAEVTLGGVDTNWLDARSLMAKSVPGLYFVGEVVDVTGWLGGYNFQWAWASGWAAGQVA
jgi:predicted Rossmann fold flavoprotein